LHNSGKIILGIDPGTLLMGYGIIEINGNVVRMKVMQALKLTNQKDNYQRLQLIHQKVAELIETFRPHEFAIEAPFFGKNVQSMLKLGRAQGVAIAAAMSAGVPVTEYSPKKVKQSVTGNGNAGKEQVVEMLQQLLELTKSPSILMPLMPLLWQFCHHFQTRTTLLNKNKTGKGWNDFIRNNPGRLVKKITG
jgi:crossover junction endodeoxyribonuclease RuvC